MKSSESSNSGVPTRAPMFAAAAGGAAVGTTVETGAAVVTVTAGEPLVVLSSVTDAEGPEVDADVWDGEDGL